MGTGFQGLFGCRNLNEPRLLVIGGGVITEVPGEKGRMVLRAIVWVLGGKGEQFRAQRGKVGH